MYPLCCCLASFPNPLAECSTELTLAPSLLQEVSQAEFVERFERPRIPVVITNLQEGWPAQELWNQQRLLERFGDHKFKVCCHPEQLGLVVGMGAATAAHLYMCKAVPAALVLSTPRQ